MIQRTVFLEKLDQFKDKQIIKVVTGIRRCGKSVLLEQFREKLLSSGVTADSIISVNFENPDFEPLQNARALYEYVSARLQKEHMTYIFLDEVQQCEEFQKAVDGLFIKKNTDLYLTGSNSTMLSGELATLLSGRYITIEMTPLSFSEYSEGRKEMISGKPQLPPVESLYRDYVRFGSFPFILQFGNNEESIHQYLDGIYHTIILKDIVSRYQIKDVMILEDVLKFLMHNIGSPSTSKKISSTLTSAGRKTSQPTVDMYLQYLSDCFLVYPVQRYDIKGKQYLKSLCKYYISDTGLRNYLLGFRDIDAGHILENLVYLELRRRGYKIYTGKAGTAEVDFVAVNQKETVYIQSAETVKPSGTLERELAPLKSISDFYPRVLITADYDFNNDYNGIRHINAYEFLSGGSIF